jgi:hypothetical protein
MTSMVFPRGNTRSRRSHAAASLSVPGRAVARQGQRTPRDDPCLPFPQGEGELAEGAVIYADT